METIKDELDRAEFNRNLYNFIIEYGENDNGLTILLNGKFGSGKTTEFDLFHKHCEKNDSLLQIIKYNVWQNNFFNEPLIPLLKSLNDIKNTKTKIVETSKTVIKKFLQVASATLANAHSVDITPLFNNIDFFTALDEYNNVVKEYREVLKVACEEQKVVLIIDELDRCFPDYQIKLLESIHHLLGIKNLIVIIGVDKSQLEKTIEKFYGNDNLFGYLAKFIDYEIDLPKGNKNKLISNLLNEFIDKSSNPRIMVSQLNNIIISSSLDTREQINIIKIFKLVYKHRISSVKECRMFLFILICKFKYQNAYYKYFYNEKIEKLNEKNKAYDIKIIEDFKSSFYDDFITKLENNLKYDNKLFIDLYAILLDYNYNKKEEFLEIINPKYSLKDKIFDVMYINEFNQIIKIVKELV